MRRSRPAAVKKTVLDLPTSAKLSGFPEQHFQTLLKKRRIRVFEIDGKEFVLVSDLEKLFRTPPFDRRKVKKPKC